MTTRLYRSNKNKMIGGVCSGLAQYLRLDVTLVRLFFVLLAVSGEGIGVLAYILLWMIAPVADEPERTMSERVQAGAEEMAETARGLGADVRGALSPANPQRNLLIGGALVLLGVLFLVKNLNWYWLRWLDFDKLWPLLLIAGGIALLRKGQRDV